MIRRKPSLLGPLQNTGQTGRTSMESSSSTTGSTFGLISSGPTQDHTFLRRVYAFMDDRNNSGGVGIGPASDEVPLSASSNVVDALDPNVLAAYWSTTDDHMYLQDVPSYGTMAGRAPQGALGLSHLDSPKGRGSVNGIPTVVGTGGGHGEQPPTSIGYEGASSRHMHTTLMNHHGGSETSPWGAAYALPTSKATPLARHVTTRTLLSTSVRHMGVPTTHVRYRDNGGSATQLYVGSTAAPAVGVSASASSNIVSYATPQRSSSSGTMGRFSGVQRAASTALLILPSSTEPSSPIGSCPNTPHRSDTMPARVPHLSLPTSPAGLGQPLVGSGSPGPSGPATGSSGGMRGSGHPSSPNTHSRALAPSPSPGASASLLRPSRHSLLSYREQPLAVSASPPVSSCASPHDGYLECTPKGHGRGHAGAASSTSAPVIPAASAPAPAAVDGGYAGHSTGGLGRPLVPVAAVAAAAAAPIPTFVAKQLPSNGLVYLWPDVPKAMKGGEWSMSEYTITRQLHNGYASCVYKATCLRSGQDVVLKAYTLSSLSDFLRNQMLRELDIHSRLQHPSVVQLLAAFKEGDLLVMVLEYVRGGSLDRARRKLGGRMTEQQALELVMVPLLRTLHYMHTQSIVHRDIKPANLLFSPDWKLKVCDYGVSVCLLDERAVTRTGSRDYMAPEVNVCPLKRTPADNKDNPDIAYGTAVDVWSLGALAYELLVGFTPFPGGPPATRKGDPTKSLVFPSSVTSDARTFVLSCLEHSPAERPTVPQLLRHRWVLGATLADKTVKHDA